LNVVLLSPYCSWLWSIYTIPTCSTLCLFRYIMIQFRLKYICFNIFFNFNFEIFTLIISIILKPITNILFNYHWCSVSKATFHGWNRKWIKEINIINWRIEIWCLMYFPPLFCYYLKIEIEICDKIMFTMYLIWWLCIPCDDYVYHLMTMYTMWWLCISFDDYVYHFMTMHTDLMTMYIILWLCIPTWWLCISIWLTKRNFWENNKRKDLWFISRTYINS
jgi:hypothetical protein